MIQHEGIDGVKYSNADLIDFMAYADFSWHFKK